MSPFEYVKSVWNTKEYQGSVKELIRKDYNPFLVNRALSNSELGVLFANEMNKYAHLDPDIQYDFYFYGVPKQRSYLKWSKKNLELNEQDVELVQEYFNVSYDRAVEYLGLINISELRNLKGGK